MGKGNPIHNYCYGEEKLNNSTEKKGGRDFECWGELKVLENIRGELGQCDKAICICQVSQLPSRKRLEDRGSIILYVYISKGWIPGPWERHSWVVKLATGWEIYISKEQTKNLRLWVFWSNCSKKRKVRGAYSQEETYLKFSQAEEH